MVTASVELNPAEMAETLAVATYEALSAERGNDLAEAVSDLLLETVQGLPPERLRRLADALAAERA